MYVHMARSGDSGNSMLNWQAEGFVEILHFQTFALYSINYWLVQTLNTGS